VLVFLFCF